MAEHDYQIFTRSSAFPFPRTGLIRNYANFGYTKRYQAVGEFAFDIGEEQPDVPRCAVGNIVEVVRDGITDFYGYIMGNQHTLDEKSPATSILKCKGVDLSGWILRRRCAVPPPGSQYYGNLGPAETVMQAAITDHFVAPSDLLRIMPSVVSGALHSPSLGQQVVVNLKGETWDGAMGNIALAGSVGFRTVLNSNNLWEFQVYQGRDLSYQTQSNPATATGLVPITFSPDYRDLLQFSHSLDLMGLANHVYTLGGDGTAAGRFVVEDEIVASEALWGRYEAFQDGRSAYNTTIAHTQGAIFLAPRSVVEQVSFIPRETSQIQYKTNWELGDTVTLRYDRWNVNLAAPIVEIKVSLTRGSGERIETVTNLLLPDGLRIIRQNAQAVTQALYSPYQPVLKDGRIALAQLTTNPAPGPTDPPLGKGQFYFNTSTNQFMGYDGTSWRVLAYV